MKTKTIFFLKEPLYGDESDAVAIIADDFDEMFELINEKYPDYNEYAIHPLGKDGKITIAKSAKALYDKRCDFYVVNTLTVETDLESCFLMEMGAVQDNEMRPRGQ